MWNYFMSNDSVVLGTITCLWWANKISNNTTASPTEIMLRLQVYNSWFTVCCTDLWEWTQRWLPSRWNIVGGVVKVSLDKPHLWASLSAMTRFEDAFWVRSSLKTNWKTLIWLWNINQADGCSTMTLYWKHFFKLSESPICCL